ncbi:MAG: hypothetical protein Q7U10_11475 [Thermodesulfovibrionia bacterium]|nr:hypothetical protein [Thermodesulfovibrionia bacterium]
MVTVGPDGLVILLLVFFITIAIPAWVTLFVKKKMPGKLWAGLALSFFFPMIGHLYIDGSALYIFILFGIAVIIKKATESLNIWLIMSFISALTMYIRFRKLPASTMTPKDPAKK